MGIDIIMMHITAKKAPDAHFPPDRKWKYGENLTFQLAIIDFLFAHVYIIGSISALYALRKWRNEVGQAYLIAQNGVSPGK